jgi:beta-glucanase (GH16 family)
MTALSVAVVAAAVIVGLISRASLGTDQPTSVKSAGTSLRAPESWKLAFNSNFAGTKLDEHIWGTCYPWSPNGCTNFGNNNEKEWYQTAQDQVKNGVLYLVAERRPTVGRNQDGTPMNYACRSGIVTTYPSFRFKYGYIQITARIPYGTGLWPAFWLAAANQQWPPEIDILEHWGTNPVARVFLHPKQGPEQDVPFKAPNISKSWHTFTLYWTKSRLSWYYDGRQVLTTSTGIPQQAMYFIADLAAFDVRPGACSGSVLIKSVKVWQPIAAEAST